MILGRVLAPTLDSLVAVLEDHGEVDKQITLCLRESVNARGRDPGLEFLEFRLVESVQMCLEVATQGKTLLGLLLHLTKLTDEFPKLRMRLQVLFRCAALAEPLVAAWHFAWIWLDFGVCGLVGLPVAGLGEPLVAISAGKRLVIEMGPPVDREVWSLGKRLNTPGNITEVLLLLISDLFHCFLR